MDDVLNDVVRPVSVIAVVAMLLTTGGDVRAQQPAPALRQTAPAAQPSAPQAQPNQPQVRPAIRPGNQADVEVIIVLLRSTLIAVHQANATGNYTVLRDLAAPSFQERNTAADLSQIFANLRQQRVDLGAGVLLDAKFTQAPVIDQQNMLRFAGTLQTKPNAVAFELAFQPLNGVWRLFSIAISPQAGPPTASNEAPSAPARPAPAPSTKGPSAAPKGTSR